MGLALFGGAAIADAVVDKKKIKPSEIGLGMTESDNLQDKFHVMNKCICWKF